MAGRFQYSLKTLWAVVTAAALIAAAWSYLPAQVRVGLAWLVLPLGACLMIVATHYVVTCRTINALPLELDEIAGGEDQAPGGGR